MVLGVDGWDVTGTVHSLGEGVEAWQLGDRFAAMVFQPVAQNGTYTQYLNLNADLLARAGGSAVRNGSDASACRPHGRAASSLDATSEGRVWPGLSVLCHWAIRSTRRALSTTGRSTSWDLTLTAPTPALS